MINLIGLKSAKLLPRIIAQTESFRSTSSYSSLTSCAILSLPIAALFHQQSPPSSSTIATAGTSITSSMTRGGGEPSNGELQENLVILEEQHHHHHHQHQGSNSIATARRFPLRSVPMNLLVMCEDHLNYCVSNDNLLLRSVSSLAAATAALNESPDEIKPITPAKPTTATVNTAVLLDHEKQMQLLEKVKADEKEREDEKRREDLQERANKLLSECVRTFPRNLHASLSAVRPEFDNKVDAVMRNHAVIEMRALQRAYFADRLSPATFTKAVRLLDTFVHRIKVKPMYLTVTLAACLEMAHRSEKRKERDNDEIEKEEEHGEEEREHRGGGTLLRDIWHVMFAGSPVKLEDVQKMQSIVLEKLRGFCVPPHPHTHSTPPPVEADENALLRKVSEALVDSTDFLELLFENAVSPRTHTNTHTHSKWRERAEMRLAGSLCDLEIAQSHPAQLALACALSSLRPTLLEEDKTEEKEKGEAECVVQRLASQWGQDWEEVRRLATQIDTQLDSSPSLCPPIGASIGSHSSVIGLARALRWTLSRTTKRSLLSRHYEAPKCLPPLIE